MLIKGKIISFGFSMGATTFLLVKGMWMLNRRGSKIKVYTYLLVC